MESPKTDMKKNNDPIHIIADDRERKSDVIELLLEIDNVEVDIRRLSIGDYQIGNRVIIHAGVAIGSDGFGFATDTGTGTAAATATF